MTRAIALAVFVATVCAVFVLAYLWRDAYGRLFSWLMVAVGVVAVIIAVPEEPRRSLRGVLVDERNRFSQPNLVTLCWFVIIVSAYLSCALWNTALWNPSGTNLLPVFVKVPQSIWVLAGIVGVDLIAGGVIISNKRRQGLSDAKGITISAPPNPLFVRSSPAEATAADLVTYDEVGVHETPDLAALQKLLFQIAAVTIYAFALGRLIFATAAVNPIVEFPAIPEGFLALLGISTATAIVSRAVPR